MKNRGGINVGFNLSSLNLQKKISLVIMTIYSMELYSFDGFVLSDQLANIRQRKSGFANGHMAFVRSFLVVQKTISY